VYACGSRQPLFARPERVSAIQALLHVLTRLADSGAAACPELHVEGVAVWPPAADRCGVWVLCTPISTWQLLSIVHGSIRLALRVAPALW
jgi:hypothetical protein